MSYDAHITTAMPFDYSVADIHEERQDDLILLDRRYRVSRAIEQACDEQRFPAFHVELAIPVCITTLHPYGIAPAGGHSAHVSDSSTSFWKLALQAAHLRHPVLPRVRDSFLQGGTYYVVTDDPAHLQSAEPDASHWHPVETLAQRLERAGRLSLREALIFGLQLCDALAYVQQRAPSVLPLTTIMPRLLVLPQPNTIMLSEMRPLRWLDAARCACDDADRPYSAPEIAASATQDVRADIYGIAAVIYHMLAGAPPDLPATENERPTLAEVEPLIPAALSDVIGRALRPDPDARFADADAFGRALAGALNELLPALVARITAPYAGADELPISRERRKPPATAVLLPHSSISDDLDGPYGPRDRHRAETRAPAKPAIERLHIDPVVRRRPPKHQKRGPLAALSAVLLGPRT